MFRVSNNVIGVLNALTLIASIPMIVASVWFHAHGSSECQRFLQLPLLTLGVFLLVVSLLGLVGSCCRVTFLLWIYLFVMFVLILGLFFFTIFLFVVTNKGAGQALSGKGYKEYRLGDYSNWLQNNVVNGKNWDKIKSCLIDAKVCNGIGHEQKAADFFMKNLSPIQSGCCKPPTDCGFEYKNATFWTVPKSGPAAADSDCKTWSNRQDKLCFDCTSCKAGALANLRHEWKKIAIFNICALLFLISVYTVGCCAFRNNRSDQYKRYRGYP